jgi:hypothetical protein
MPSMLIRGTFAMPWILKPDGDPSWTEDDWGRAATLEIRWTHMGVSELDRRILLPCAVWKAKFPGLQYSALVESKLRALAA